MTTPRQICTVFLRELLRVTAWGAKFCDIDFSREHATDAMTELFRQAAYGLETSEGPFERLYMLWWQSHTRNVPGGADRTLQDAVHTMPSPTVEEVDELCQVYAEVARLSLESETSTDEIATVMTAMAQYRFRVDDVFELIYCLDGPTTSALIMGNAIACANAKSVIRQSYAVFAASLYDSEKEKADNWLYAHMF